LTHPYGLQESPTRTLLQPTNFHAVIDLPVDDDERHPNPSITIVDPDNNDTLSNYLTKWYDCNDEEFDYSSELDAIVEACECMQQ